jgi:hypothetical protein
MRMISFKDWLVAQEDSAFGRARKAAALDLGPDIPDAAINSRNTAPPWQQELFEKKKKKKKGKDKDKDKDSDSKEVTEKTEPSVHTDIDSWIKSADNLKRDLDKLKATLGAKTQKVTLKGKTEPEDSDDDAEDEKSSKKPFPPKPEKPFPPKPEKGKAKPKPEKEVEEPEEPEESKEPDKSKSPKSKTAFGAFIARKETKK